MIKVNLFAIYTWNLPWLVSNYLICSVYASSFHVNQIYMLTRIRGQNLASTSCFATSYGHEIIEYFCVISVALGDLNGRIINEGDFVIVKHTRDRFLAYITKVERVCGKYKTF